MNNLEELLRKVFTEERIDPKDKTSHQYRAYYQKDEDTRIYLSGWFSSVKLALENAKKNLR